MEYEKRSSNGDAGEYFVAHKVTRVLGWPCRLIGVDIGIDAEMEVMDDDGKSTGNIIKIQIKSFESVNDAEAKAVYVNEDHINYWKRFCLPVIICCVDLAGQRVFWKQITATEAYESGGVSKKISFSLTDDIFDQNSKSKLKKLVTPEESKRIDELFVRLDQIAASLPTTTTGYVDFQAISHTEDLCKKTTEIIKEIDGLIVHFPWRVSSLALRKLNNIRTHVRSNERDCNYYHSALGEGG